MATTEYSTLAPHRDALALIEGKKPDLMRKSEAATRFWTNRNVTRLVNTYEETCKLVGSAHHESVYVMKELVDQLEAIRLKSEAFEAEEKPLEVHRGVKLMSTAEVTEFQKSVAARMHILALKEFEDPSINRTSNLSVNFSTGYITADSAFTEACDSEKQLQFGELNFEDASAFRQETDTIRNIMNNTSKITNPFDALYDSYRKQLTILRKEGLTVASVYRSWVINLDIQVTRLQSAVESLNIKYKLSKKEHYAQVEAIKEKYSDETSQMQSNIAAVKEKFAPQITPLTDEIKVLASKLDQLDAKTEREVKALEREIARSRIDTQDLIGLKDLEKMYYKPVKGETDAERAEKISTLQEIDAFKVAASKTHLELRTKNKATIEALLANKPVLELEISEKISTLEKELSELNAQAKVEIEVIQQGYAPTAAQIKEEVDARTAVFETSETSSMDKIAALTKLLIDVTSKMRPQIHAEAHKEYLEYLEMNSYIARLMVAKTQPLFDKSKEGYICVYNSETNTFEDIDQKTISEAHVKETLNEIRHLVYLLSRNHSDAFEKLKTESGEETVGKVIGKLIAKMHQVENSYYKGVVKSFSNPKRAKKTESELVAHIKSHIQDAIEHFTLESEKSRSTQLKVFFKEDSASLFYLQLAESMDIVEQVTPGNLRSQLGRILTSIQSTSVGDPKVTMREKSARTEHQGTAARRIQRLTKIGETPECVAYKAREIDTFKSQMVDESEKMIRFLGELETLPNPRKLEEIREFTAGFHEEFRDALYYLELAAQIPGFEYTFNLKDGTVVAFTPELVSVVHAMVGQYLLNIRPYLASERGLTALQDLMAIPKGEEAKSVAEVQRVQLGKLQKTFGETLIMGLRFYHTHMALLTNYLDWSQEELDEMFLDHTLKMALMKKEKTKKVPNGAQLRAYKTKISRSSSMINAIATAKANAKEFRAVLDPFRQVQTAAYLFFNELSNLLIKDSNYLTLPDLNVEDIDLLDRYMDEIDTEFGVFNQTEESAAQSIKDHLPAIKKIITESSPEDVVQNLTTFFETPLAGTGDILAFKKVSVLNLKLVIKILKLTKSRDEIKTLNIKAMNALFTQSGTSWDKYTKQTARFSTDRSAQTFDQFTLKTKLNAVKTAAYSPTVAFEYFKAAEPFVVHQAVVHAIYLKWTAFIKDLTKRFAHDELGPLGFGIAQAAATYNEAKRTEERFA